jgi:hypothetical protein
MGPRLKSGALERQILKSLKRVPRHPFERIHFRYRGLKATVKTQKPQKPRIKYGADMN